MKNNINLGKYFDSLFCLTVANTTQLKQEVYKIRYQVYCQELQYEPQENFPDQMEQDSFDYRSIHILLKYKLTDSYIGCARIVLADPNQPEALFPFEKVSQHKIDFSQQPRKHFCEVSRLAVRGEFRRRKGEKNTPQGLLFFNDNPPNEIEEKRIASLIPMSLYFASICASFRLGLNILFLSETRLARHLQMCDIPNYQIGNSVEFHGKRSPFLIYPEEVVQKLNSTNRQLFERLDYSLGHSLNYTSQTKHKNKLLSCELPHFSSTIYRLA